MSMREKYLDGLMGFAIGDAMGFPVVNKTREELLANPVTKMIPHDLYKQPEGTWSTLTSLLIATIDSVNVKNTFDYMDISLKFSAFKNHASFTPYNEVFFIEKTTKDAIDLYEEKRENLVECGISDSFSNGSLMRILPVAYYALENKLKDEEIFVLTKDLSSLTHKNEVVLMGCYLFIRYIIFLLNGKDKFSAYSMTKCVDYSMFSEDIQGYYNRILKEDISKLNVNAIHSSSSVVDTLEASLWVTLKSENFIEAVIGAVNLGEDTSSIGALVAFIAGLVYGYEAIPTEWKDTLVRKEYLLDIFEEFSENKYDI